MSRRRAFGLSRALGVLAVVDLLAAVGPVLAEEAVLIGKINSRTGLLAAQGLASARGIRIAVDGVSARGGGDGRPIRLLERADAGTRERAIAVAEERHRGVALVGGHVDGLVGSVSEAAGRTRVPHRATAFRVVHRGCVLDDGRAAVAGPGPARIEDAHGRRTLFDLGHEAPA